jgi:hypothetical protein
VTEENVFNSPKGEKIPSISFTDTDPVTGVMSPKPIGTRLGGKIKKAPELIQQTKFKTNEPLFWKKKGDSWEKVIEETQSPAMTVVTTLETTEGDRSLWAPKSSKDGSLCKAIADAIAASGSKTAVVGGELWVTLTKISPNPQGGQPSKEYAATYSPPNQFAEAPAPPAPRAPAAPPTPAPAPPAPPAAPATTPEGYTMASLTAAGWTAEQIVAQYPMLGAAPAAPSAPPAPPAPPSAQATSKLAELSDEDLDMVGWKRLPDGSIVQK